VKDKGSENPNEVAAVLTEYDCGFLEGVGVRQSVRSGEDLQAKVNSLETRNHSLVQALVLCVVVLSVLAVREIVLWGLR
jgi:nitrate reductase NapE component